MVRPSMRFVVVCLAVVSAVCLGAGSGKAVETARVEVIEGAPRLVVDGKPVRARMFLGAPGPGRVWVGAEAQQISFQFTAQDDEPQRATIHFRFENEPGTIELDDIRIFDLTDQHEVLPLCRFEGGMTDFTRVGRGRLQRRERQQRWSEDRPQGPCGW